MKDYKYFAFISYNSQDIEWGKRLQRKLEHYRMPATLCSEHGWKRKPINPVFFAPTDIQGGRLSAELQSRLQASRHLIVICSPHSAQSQWVGKEIAFFHQLGRTEQIHFFIVDGIPNSGREETECFNAIVKTLGLPEILGVNIHEKIYRWPWLNRERAYVQLITKLLGIEFDTIWQRHKRLLVQQVIILTACVLSVLAIITAVWLKSQPIDVAIRLNETSVHNRQLPPMRDAIITMTLDNERKTDTISILDDKAIFRNIPHRYLDQHVQIQVACQHFLPVDTALLLAKDLVIHISRNPSDYGNIRFLLRKSDVGTPLPNTEVVIGGHPVQSDADGIVTLTIPLSEQRTAYAISAQRPLTCDSIYMPCGPDVVIDIR